MIFTSTVKAELLAFVDSLEPSVDTAPLLARIVELEVEVAALTATINLVRAAVA